MKSLGERGGKAAATEIKKQIVHDELPQREPREVADLLWAYARVGGDTAARDLVELAHKSPMIGKAKWLPVRLAAIRALSACTDATSLGELGVLARSGQGEIAQAAETALTARRRGHAHETPDDEPMGDDE